MGLLSLFFRTRRNEPRLAIDIGSNHKIRTLAFLVRENRLVVRQKDIVPLPMREDDQALILSIREALHKLVSHYVRTLGKAPGKTVVGLGSHFIKNEILTIRYERVRPGEALRPEELEEAVRAFLDRRTAEGRTNALLLTHAAPFHIAVDGYEIPGAGTGAGGRSVEIRLLATYTARAYWNELEAFRRQWKGLNIKFIPNAVAIANAITGSLGISDALIVKIGSRITEVACIKNGKLVFSAQFDMGGDDFTVELSREFGMTFSDAERVKCQLETTLLPDRIRKRAENRVRKTMDAWMQNFSLLLSSNAGVIIPADVFILGGGARLSAAREALASRHWYESLTFLTEIKVRVMNAEEIGSHIFAKGEEPLRGPENTALAALSREALSI